MMIDKAMNERTKKIYKDINVITVEHQEEAQYVLMYEDCVEIIKMMDNFERMLRDNYDAFNPNSYEEFGEDEDLEDDE